MLWRKRSKKPDGPDKPLLFWSERDYLTSVTCWARSTWKSTNGIGQSVQETKQEKRIERIKE